MMTREQKEAVLIGFYLDGKALQYAEPETQDWIDINQPTWLWDAYDYRLKPEPVAGWFVIDKDGDVVRVKENTQQGANNEAERTTKCLPRFAPHRPIYMRECDPPEEGK